MGGNNPKLEFFQYLLRLYVVSWQKSCDSKWLDDCFFRAAVMIKNAIRSTVEDVLDTHPIFWEKITTTIIELGSRSKLLLAASAAVQSTAVDRNHTVFPTVFPPPVCKITTVIALRPQITGEVEGEEEKNTTNYTVKESQTCGRVTQMTKRGREGPELRCRPPLGPDNGAS